jgi:hypothetical protein
MLRALATLVLIAPLAACGSHSAPNATTASSAAPAPAVTNALAGTPLAGYGRDLNKAKNVQNIVDERARKRAAALEAATGSSS